MRSNVIDIIERFQARHALQEERETQNSHASTNGSVSSGVPDENGRSVGMDGCCPKRHGMVSAARWPGSNGCDAWQDTSTPGGQGFGLSRSMDLCSTQQRFQSA